MNNLLTLFNPTTLVNSSFCLLCLSTVCYIIPLISTIKGNAISFSNESITDLKISFESTASSIQTVGEATEDNNNVDWVNSIIFALTVLINLLLFTFLSLRWLQEGYFPLSNLYESLIFLVWCLTTVQLVFQVKTESQIIGAILTPLNLYLVTFSTSVLPTEMQKAAPLVPALQSKWLMLHVSTMIISYSVLILGSLLSIVFLMLFLISPTARQGYDMVVSPNKNRTSLSTEVNLDNEQKKGLLMLYLDRWSYRTLGFGVPCLTLGIISGAVWANEAWGSYWSWDPKENWALVTWIVFASYLHARLNEGWKGLEAASLGAIGFIAVWFCYLGVNFLGQGLHSYGWLNV
jgi:cytochrome c-type biogenesis protein CcsB